MSVNSTIKAFNIIKKCIIRLKYHPCDSGFQNGSKIFFVTGRSKSGTTWMGNILDSHPFIFCDTTENSAFHQDFKFCYFSDNQRLLHKQAEEFFSQRTWSLIKNGLIANLINKCNKTSVKLFGDKTPRQNISLILKHFSNTKIIIMLRDFRDVCVSLAFHNYRVTGTWKGYFADKNLKTLDNQFLIDYLSNYEDHKDYQNYHNWFLNKPDQVILIKYEDLINKPLDTLEKVFSFLGLKHNEKDLLKYYNANSFTKLSKGRKPGEEIPSSFYRKGIVGDWKNHFSSENIRVFKNICGTTLIAAGYENDNNW